MLLVVALLVVLQPGIALAQETGQADLTPRRVVAWTNPILFVFGWYTGEAEIRLQQNHTVGISGSFVNFQTGDPGDLDYEDTEYASVSFFYRYYPTAAFKGFFIGAQVGNVQVNQKESASTDPFNPTAEVTESSGSAGSIGILVGYGWILGKAQRVSVSMGLGANRLFGGDVDEDVNLTVPVIRLINVGVAF
jgi:hypothetical protein